MGYSQIPHFECCSGAELNPISAENMVAFFTPARWDLVLRGNRYIRTIIERVDMERLLAKARIDLFLHNLTRIR
jgi:hypothetical protein